jgi:hypothetical protein
MKLASFDVIVAALNDAQVRFIIVGGLAVNAHGYLRVTNDIDLVIRLEVQDITAAFAALRAIDYHPSVPITAEQFADPSLREQWRSEKGMQVLKFWSDSHRETPLDVFLYHPFDFDREYERAITGKELGDPPARFASAEALIAMKEVSDRDIDRIDIAKLRELKELGTYES